MRTALLLIAVMVPAAPPGASQAVPFTCWIRGSANELARRPSPLDSATVEIGGATLKVCYGRPSARGRKIMGGVVPFGEPAYYELRPSIAIPKPSGSNAGDSAVDLNGFFGLHPSLATLKPIYDAKALAIVHAAGSPDPTRCTIFLTLFSAL